MSLKTRFGNLKNVLDQDNSQTEILQLDSPFVSNARFAAMAKQFGDAAVEIDCTFPAGADANALQAALARIRAEAEEAVRAGANHIVLSDVRQAADKVAMPMILATSAVHSWLTRKGLRTFTSLNVRSAECIDPHYFAVLIGCGATTVNAYLAEDSIADRIARGLIAGSLTEAVERYRNAIDQGLLKIMSKMGISVISSYRGGLNFEAVGPQPGDGGGVFPRHAQPHLRHRRHRRAAAGRGGARPRLARRRHGAADRRLLQGAPLRGEPRLGGAGDAHPAGGLRPGVLRALEAVFPRDAGAPADPPARPAGLPAEGRAGAARRGRDRSPPSASAS